VDKLNIFRPEGDGFIDFSADAEEPPVFVLALEAAFRRNRADRSRGNSLVTKALHVI
jgi:hypothetical protein